MEVRGQRSGSLRKGRREGDRKEQDVRGCEKRKEGSVWVWEVLKMGGRGRGCG